ncbi:hypothetical protein BS47DRAFT_1366720 [Hydnum rufescens UP504]|uniref:Uncharacterized protein n=1 Tax=Hydnum rufescens UP504 TaxID=1448309 RepID=A0A9P6DMV5_9AGAM|nr:hypothetical protein BS47DRAFT_1366720 [Hydnum rufescens UP504]
MCSVGIPLLLAFEASLTHGAGYHIDTYLHNKNAKRLALFCGGELFCFIRGLTKTWGDGFGSAKMGDVASGAGPIIVAHPNPTPQPEDFQMRELPNHPSLSCPSPSHPSSPVVRPQIGIATIIITAVIVLSIVVLSIVIPSIAVRNHHSCNHHSPKHRSHNQPLSPWRNCSPHPSISSTVLSNQIVSLEIELQEVTEALEAMTQSRDEVRLVLGNILAALNTIVENTQLGGT